MRAEVLVFGQQHSSVSARERQDDLVIRARVCLDHSPDIVSSSVEGGDHREVAALVSQEPHGLRRTLGLDMRPALMTCSDLAGRARTS